MSYLKTRPRWWQLYLILPLLIILFVGDNRLKISSRGHQAVQIGIVLAIYVLVHLWLKANAAALSKMDREQLSTTFKVYRIPPKQLPASDSEKHPMIQLPDTEIRDLLGTTFEIDYIDAECIEVGEAPQESKKE